MQTVLITGGTRGIGESTVKLFANNNYNVIFFYKNNSSKADELSKKTQALAMQVDVASSQEVETAVKYILEKYNKIDVLVNNAGIAQSKLFTEISNADWQTMINTNLSSVFYTCRAVLPNMIYNKKGKIINVSSVWGIAGASMEVHYSAAKAGIIGLTKALAREVAPSGINVNCIAPGAINTDMLLDYTEQEILDICDKTPLMRLGKPEEVAELILFLASDKSNFITGQTISIDGAYL